MFALLSTAQGCLKPSRWDESITAAAGGSKQRRQVLMTMHKISTKQRLQLGFVFWIGLVAPITRVSSVFSNFDFSNAETNGINQQNNANCDIP